jgi:hypothetical protein
MMKEIHSFQTCNPRATKAVEEFHDAVAQSNPALVIFFCSSDYDLDVLAAEIGRRFADVPTIGCTTAGEIGPVGCREHSFVGASLSSTVCQAVVGTIDQLHNFGMSMGQTLGKHLLETLYEKAPGTDTTNSFGLLLIDGLSAREETVARAYQAALGPIPLVGGSAGDGLHFRRTCVYYQDRFHADAAVIALLTTSLPFTVFKTQHFTPMEKRVVITEADPARRIVKEINGSPAAQEYARLLGIEVTDLTPSHFAASPVVVLIDGNNYVRSIQKVNPDGSITFYCAIEEGVVLRVAHGIGLVDNLEQAFAQIRSKVGAPQLVIGYDCILRRLESLENHSEGQVESIFRTHNVVGFNTYGEQFHGVHVNQTLTGVALGSHSGENHRA